MKLTVVVGLLTLVVTTVVTYAASAASDNASNSPYEPGGIWTSGQNGGYGFGPWSLNSGGLASGEYIGDSGAGTSPTWGLFAGNNAGIAYAIRPFTGSLTPGQTFSITLGATAIPQGNVGLQMLDGVVDEVFFSALSGSPFWQISDGGMLFNTSIPVIAGDGATANPLNFNFTYNGGESYSVLITEGANMYAATLTAHQSIDNLNGVLLFSSNQGVGNNFGANNLSVVPEPAAIVSFLLGSHVLGAALLIRNRRARTSAKTTETI